jgi:hypothetical protein
MRGYPVFKVLIEAPGPPPRERLRTHRWGQFFGASLDYLIFLLDGASTINIKTSTTSPREVSELKVWERPPST